MSNPAVQRRSGVGIDGITSDPTSERRTTMATNYAQAERTALCDLFLELGPQAPTLCEGWTTRDLAAHLVVRDRRPDGAIGILVPRLSGHTEKLQAAEAG